MVENTVLVGDKKLGRYCKAVQKQLENDSTVKILSRGQENNGKALDVVEIVRREQEVWIDMKTDTQRFRNSDDEQVQVTELQAEIEKKKKE